MQLSTTSWISSFSNFASRASSSSGSTLRSQCAALPAIMPGQREVAHPAAQLRTRLFCEQGGRSIEHQKCQRKEIWRTSKTRCTFRDCCGSCAWSRRHRATHCRAANPGGPGACLGEVCFYLCYVKRVHGKRVSRECCILGLR